MKKNSTIEHMTLKVLFLEDSWQDVELITKQLSIAGYQLDVTHAATEVEYIEALEKNCFDIILADFKLPGLDAFDALEICQKFCPQVPFICVSGTIGEETAIELLKKGAVDYVFKDRPERLPYAIKRAITEAAEIKARRESDAQFKAMFENMAFASCLDEIVYENSKAVDYIILDVNPSYERITGLKREEVIGRNASDLYGTKDVPFLDTYAKVGETGKPAEFEAYFPPLDKFLHVTAGCPQRGFFSTVFSDITERKQVEKALRQSEEKLRSYIEYAPDGVFITDENGNYVEVNPAASVITGYSREELLTLNFSDTLQQEYLEIGLQHFQEVQKKGFARGDIGFVTKDGENRFWNVAAVKLSDKRFLGFVKDVTDQKLAEAEMRELKNRYQGLFENSLIGIGLATPEGEIIESNQAFADMLGYSVSELQKIKIIDSYLNPDDRRHVGKILKEKKQVVDFETKLKRKDNTTIDVLLNISIVKMKGKTLLQTSCQDITERKQAEEALRVSEEKYRTLVEGSLQGVVIAQDEPVRLTFANTAMENLLGYSVEDLLSMGASQLAGLIHPDDRQRFFGNFRRRLAGESVPSLAEYRCLRKDGEMIWVMRQSSAIDYFGVPATLTVFIDISEHKRTEKALEQSKKSYAAIYNSSTDCIFIHDGKTGEIVDVNQATIDTFGYSKDEITKLNVGDFSLNEPPYTQKEAAAFIHKAVKEGPQFFDWLAKKKNGELIWFENSLQYVELAGEKRVLVVGRDITERKQAEEALRISEEQYRLLFESANVGIFIAQDGYVKTPNPYLYQITGYTLAELDEQPFTQFIHPEDLPLVAKRHQERLSGKPGLPPAYDFRIISKDGTILWVQLSTVLIEWHGKPATLNFLHNITERIHAEERVIQELKQKNILLQELYHRTKNNMQVITAMLELQSQKYILEHPINIEGFEFIQKTYQEMINRINAMALVHQKLYQTQDLSQINLNEYIRELVSMISRSYARQSANVTLDFNLEDVFVLIDSAIPLGLVLNELVTNTYKHAFPGNNRGVLKINLKRDKQDMIHLRIEDNGVGLPAGMDLRKVDSMGLDTIINLVEYQLRGSFSYRVENGLKWDIEYKDNLYARRV